MEAALDTTVYEAYFFWCGVAANIAGLLFVALFAYFHIAEGWFEWGSRSEIAKKKRDAMRA